MKLKKSMMLATAGATLSAAVLMACGGSDPDLPENVRMTWFGITNWHYQIANTGILLDGETISDFSANPMPNVPSVTKAFQAVKMKGNIDVILVGHEHGDHGVQVPEWAKQTGKPVYAPAAVCAAVAKYGVPATQCTTLKGGETIKMNEEVTIRVVRWVHSVSGCTAFGNGVNGPETFGFLISAKTAGRPEPLQLFVSDSGAGGKDLTTPRVADGVTYGSPLDNLKAAMTAAGATSLDLWQGGPESRVVTQARLVVPAFKVKTFMPHHLGVRANSVSEFKLEYGLHFPYEPSEQPLLRDFLAAAGVPQVAPANYWDAWSFDATGVKLVDSASQKAVYGIPATGAGPGKQGENPRAGQLECAGD
ncbi:MAG: MBL fold metallo-hydrolase [Ramlibacter sp.]